MPFPLSDALRRQYTDTLARAGYASTLPPYDVQLEALALSFNKRRFALFLEQGLGKTKVIYDTCALLYAKGAIRGLLVFAPNDVHEQWVEEQLPLHWDRSRAPVRAAVWRSRSAKLVKQCTELASKPLPDRFAVLAMNYEALTTARGVKCATQFLRTYPALLCLDEGHAIKTPKAETTKAALRLAKLAPVRRIATGTPKTQSPFDFYSEMEFLDPRILQFDSFVAFRARYGVFTTEYAKQKNKKGEMVLREYKALAHYQRLDELNARMAPFVYKARKADCVDLPEKIPLTRHVSFSPAQRAAYDGLKEHGLLLLDRAERTQQTDAEMLRFLKLDELSEDDIVERAALTAGRVSLKIKLVLALRLHQIVGGFLTDDDKVTRPLDPLDKAPRLSALRDVVREHLDSNDGKCIVWAAFRAELDAAASVLRSDGHNVVCIHGGTRKGERADAIAAFKDERSPVRVLVAHPRTMGTGQNLTVATASWYYSNPRSYVLRAQSEDRIHRIGMRGAVVIGDIVARPRAVDSTVLGALRDHADVAQFFMNASTAQFKSQL